MIATLCPLEASNIVQLAVFGLAQVAKHTRRRDLCSFVPINIRRLVQRCGSKLLWFVILIFVCRVFHKTTTGVTLDDSLTMRDVRYTISFCKQSRVGGRDMSRFWDKKTVTGL